VVAGALAQGHAVTAFSRHPETLTISHANLTTVAGDATDPEAIAHALPGHDAVICTLGRGMSLKSEHLMERCMAAIVPAMQRLGPRRFVYMSAFGVGDTARFAPWYMRLQFRTMLASIYADKEKAEAAVRGSGLEWTLVNPVMITNDPAIPKYRALEELRGVSGAKIPRANVAAFMLKCVSDTSMIGKRLILSP
jgi:uncharacterized protein YbjT (DUF2867 family)